MKNLVLSIATAVAVIAGDCLTADAQAFTYTDASRGLAIPETSGFFPLLTGGSTQIPALSTNTFFYGASAPYSTNVFGVPSASLWGATNLLTVNCTEIQNVGVTFSFTGTANSTNALAIYVSRDGGFTYCPFWTSGNLSPGAALYGTNFNLYVPGATTLAFAVTGTGTTGSTNALLEANLSYPKYGSVQEYP